MLDKISQFIHTVDGYVWGWGMIVLLLGTHLYFTVRLKFIQIPTLTKGIKLSVTKRCFRFCGFCNIAGGNHRNGKYRRCRNGNCFGRSGCSVVVLADRSFRHCD